MKRYKNKKGFTIVELVIVIAVIAILAGVLIPTFSGVVNKANNSARQQSFTNALKVVLAGNAETGGLAAGTVFVSGDGYYAIYNGNKLSDISTIMKDNTVRNFTLNADGTFSIGTVMYKNDVNDANGVIIKTVILPYNNDGTADANSISVLTTKLGTSLKNNVGKYVDAATSNPGTISLGVVSNVDLPSGFLVLSPSTTSN